MFGLSLPRTLALEEIRLDYEVIATNRLDSHEIQSRC